MLWGRLFSDSSEDCRGSVFLSSVNPLKNFNLQIATPTCTCRLLKGRRIEAVYLSSSVLPCSVLPASRTEDKNDRLASLCYLGKHLRIFSTQETESRRSNASVVQMKAAAHQLSQRPISRQSPRNINTDRDGGGSAAVHFRAL